VTVIQREARKLMITKAPVYNLFFKDHKQKRHKKRSNLSITMGATVKQTIYLLPNKTSCLNRILTWGDTPLIQQPEQIKLDQ
jgi:hypothetical protein